MRKLLIGAVAVLCAGIVLVLVGEINLRFTPADAQDQNGDEIPVARFQILFETGELEGFFTEASGIGSESDVIEQKVVGKKGVEEVIKIPGRVKLSDITLKRGLTSNTDLWDWRKMVEDGEVQAARKNGSIIMFNQELVPVAVWDFKNAWPSKITGPSFKSDENSFGVEEVTITHEGYKRIQ